MKKILTLIAMAITAASTLSCGAAWQQTKEEKAREAARTAAYIDNAVRTKSFTIDITRIFPVAFPSRETLNEYQITFDGDKVTCRLPYIGGSRTAAFGNDDISIVLEKQKVLYTDDFSDADEGEYRFLFKANSGRDAWKFTIQIYDNGSAFIGCDSNNKDNIRYSGEVVIK